MVVVVQIAAAETCCSDLDLEVVWAWGGEGAVFDSEVFGAVEGGCEGGGFCYC